jgi:hypothetical protein
MVENSVEKLLLGKNEANSMFVERKVPYSAFFTNLFGWHAGAVSFPLSDVILAQLTCPLSDVMFYLLTYLSTNIGLIPIVNNSIVSINLCFTLLSKN